MVWTKFTFSAPSINTHTDWESGFFSQKTRSSGVHVHTQSVPFFSISSKYDREKKKKSGEKNDKRTL